MSFNPWVAGFSHVAYTTARAAYRFHTALRHPVRAYLYDRYLTAPDPTRFSLGFSGRLGLRFAPTPVQAKAALLLGSQINHGKVMARTAIQYLVKSNDLTPAQKAELWIACADRIERLAMERWYSRSYRGADRSYIFIGGEDDQALVIPESGPNAGVLFRGQISPKSLALDFVPDLARMRRVAG